MIDKVLIIISTVLDENPYLDRSHNRINREIGDFLPIEYPHDFVVKSGKDVFGRSYQKASEAMMENPDYAYYMLLHDDYYEFQKGWLDKSIELCKEYDNNICVCHQNLSPKGLPGYYPMGRANSQAHWCLTTDLELAGMFYQILTKYFEKDEIIIDGLASGEGLLIPQKCAKKIIELGGLPYHTPDYKGPISYNGFTAYERIWSAMITTLGFKILDFAIDGKHIYKHQNIAM